MTRFGNAFAIAAALLSYSELAAATTSPTKSPTTSPTVSPTDSPSSSPTKSPSASPSASPTVYEGTSEWYADTANGNLCSKDCASGGSDADCSGVNHDTASWLQDTYATAALCCSNKFSYLDTDYCADRSSAAPAGTNKYYADTATSSCKVDDSASLGPFQSNTLFDTAAACCSGALGWINSEYCESRSAGGSGYTDKWYVDYSNMVCKKDCATSGGAMCLPTTDSSSSNMLFASAEACCSDKLGWIPSTICSSVSTTGTAAAATGTDKYYADYSSAPARCAKDCDTSGDPTCGGILTNVAGVQMFDSVASCCSSKFGWIDGDLCASLTTGTHTNKWYVDYSTNTCKEDCATASNSPCGGTPSDLSMQMFDTAAACCSAKLGWVNADTCAGVSTTGGASTGTLKYYADYSSGTCKKDCATSTTSPECGGILSNTAGETLFDTAAACCSGKFGWIDSALCAAMGVGGYTNKFYVDYADNACKQDCASASGTNCGGNPTDKSTQLFDSASACCDAKLSYVNEDACVSKSETGSVASSTSSGTSNTGSQKWYVDWSISKCVKDCPTGSDSECGGLAETWESAEYSSWSACCNARLSWVADRDCHL